MGDANFSHHTAAVCAQLLPTAAACTVAYANRLVLDAPRGNQATAGGLSWLDRAQAASLVGHSRCGWVPGNIAFIPHHRGCDVLAGQLNAAHLRCSPGLFHLHGCPAPGEPRPSHPQTSQGAATAAADLQVPAAAELVATAAASKDADAVLCWSAALHPLLLVGSPTILQ